MKATQLLSFEIDSSFTLKVAFRDVDARLMHLVAKLETTGDQLGPVTEVIDGKCVCLQYADKRRPATKPTIFGYGQDELLARQYRTA